MIQKKHWNSFLRAMAVTALAFLLCLGLAQQAKAPAGNASLQLELDRLNAYYNSKDYDAVFRLADSLSTSFDTTSLRADWYEVIRLSTKALKWDLQAEKAVLKLLPIVQAQTLDDSITAKLYTLLFYVNLNANQFKEGEAHAEQSLAGLIRNNCKTGLGYCIMNLGFALKEQGDYRAARQYYLSAVPQLFKEGSIENQSEALINLSDISRYIFDFKAARDYAYQAHQVYPDKARLNEHLGLADLDEGNYSSALELFLNSKKYGSPPLDIARFMGKCAEKLGDTTTANQYFSDALEAAGDARDSAVALYYIGDALFHRNQPAAALKIFQRALHELFPELTADNPADNLKTGLARDFWHITLLRRKAQTYQALYEKSNNINDLKQAEIAIKTAVIALDSLRTGMRNPLSGQDAVDYAYATYETAIEVARSLEKVQPGNGHRIAAYEYAEQAKANALKTNLAEKELRLSAAIPDSLLWQEKLANAAVAFWEGEQQPDSLLASVRRLERVRAAIAQHTPLITKAWAQYQVSPISTIQQNLSADELLLQYFWGDHALIVFSVSKKGLYIHDIPRTPALEKSFANFSNALTDYQGPPEVYEAAAYEVYQQICAPALAQAKGTKRLLIVPDGPLSSLPFEALQPIKGRFLMEDYAISYHWSGALWQQAHQRGRERAIARGYGGFAPQYNSSLYSGLILGDLPEARKAVESVAKYWSGTVFQGPEVSKALFQQEAPKFDILHLAMHGLLNKEERTQTGLAFPTIGDSIELLNTLEITQMELSAQLAVLSACNTGNGVVFRGEGVMSLSRAFALAGCPALTANLWEVPSRETNDITTDFLKHLKSGAPKDHALRTAKLDFLHRTEPERRHPYFWAGQVLIGNEEPIRQSGNWMLYLLGGLALGGLTLLAWVYKRNRFS